MTTRITPDGVETTLDPVTGIIQLSIPPGSQHDVIMIIEDLKLGGIMIETHDASIGQKP